MDKFLKRGVEHSENSYEVNSRKKHSRVEFNPDDVVSDPGLRKPIKEFDFSIRDQIRMEYLIRGPCQPIDHSFPRTQFSKDYRSFQVTWFKRFPWLEYSISKDAAFCFWCYLFKDSHRGCQVGNETFTNLGINNWKKAIEIFNTHVGGVTSAHNYARIQFESFRNRRQSVSHLLQSYGREIEVAYCPYLIAVLDVISFLLKQGLSFCEHDEPLGFSNKGNFLELLEWYTQRNKEIAKIVSENAFGNSQMTSSKVQKELTSACAAEITNAIVNDIRGNIFSLMVVESQNISVKEQIGVVLRYVNEHGYVTERFLSVVHVLDTSSISLKNVIDQLFAKHKLLVSRLRGQGYDGVSNLRHEFNGLKALILKENSSAKYVYCFSQKLPLGIVAFAKSNRSVGEFFQYVTMIVNVANASCKRKDKLQQLEHERLLECLKRGDFKRKNQEASLKRLGDTHWGSYYMTIGRFISMWTFVLQVLENVYDDGTDNDYNSIAASLIDKMESYEFVFVMYLMTNILGITNELSFVLQQKDHNIALAVSLIKTMKLRLQDFREVGWEKLLNDVNTFCCKHMIPVPNMEENMRVRGRSRRNAQMITNFHHYHVEIFREVLGMIDQEMNNCFSEESIELLTCIACLDPKNSFSQFDIGKLLRLAELYPDDFSLADRVILEEELQTFIDSVRADEEFCMIEDLESLAKKMVQTGKNIDLSLVYRLIELALVLPVASTFVEGIFSGMETVKTDLTNKMGDEWMNDRLLVYIEKEVFTTIENKQILQRFQEMQIEKTQSSPLISTPGTSSSCVNK